MAFFMTQVKTCQAKKFAGECIFLINSLSRVRTRVSGGHARPEAAIWRIRKALEPFMDWAAIKL